MTKVIGAFRYQSRRGAKRLASHVGTTLATSQKNGATAATMTTPKNRSASIHQW